MNRKTMILALGLCGIASGVFALTAEEVAQGLQGQGYSRVEVRVGPTQIKAEAIRGSEKLEVIYDSVSGQVLKSETEVVDAGDNTAPGVSIRNRNRDFVRVLRRSGGEDTATGGAEDDSNDDHGRGPDDSSGGQDDSDDDHGRGGSDDDDDDDHDDDHGGGHDDDDHGGGNDRDDDSDDD